MSSLSPQGFTIVVLDTPEVDKNVSALSFQNKMSPILEVDGGLVVPMLLQSTTLGAPPFVLAVPDRFVAIARTELTTPSNSTARWTSFETPGPAPAAMARTVTFPSLAALSRPSCFVTSPM
ncbi:unnamed protein product [Pseudo-nitzschia multistriata]|uniref:Uncharacterized protein n=1 Tax=Pseudo-nitzschia multistriata TaxID=183589 RepID=A0A448Z266_9STRA|nr:unnamed protein product [Pseudo-nitzschia multistriata]